MNRSAIQSSNDPKPSGMVIGVQNSGGNKIWLVSELRRKAIASLFTLYYHTW